ncbi:glycosyl transferase family 90-domain-containing protein [Hyaloraphidium curvatum]|nr:glycosyl transferase family 90-domain-containing protein [Hyaloraphidium curvatum]
MYGPVSGTGGAHFPYPDFFLNFDGVRGSMRRAGSEKPLGAKQPTLFFRGSSTGYMCCPAGSDWRTFPRMRFAEMCSRPEAAGKCDGGIVKYVQMSNSTVAEANATLGTKPALPLEDWVRRYRYVASIDGNGWASRFGALLAAGVAVFKQSSPFSEFFYSALKPWVHYVPMKADVSDALEKVAWADAHPEKVAAIAREGRDFVARHLRDENVRCYVAALVEEWGRRQGMVEVPEGAKLVHTLQVEPESKGEG